MRFLLVILCYVLCTTGQADVLPQAVNSFDVTVHQGVVHVLLSSPSNDKTSHVYYLRSKDGGQHWTKASTVIQNSPSLAIRGNDVQLAVAGQQLVALWQTQGELPSMGAMVSYYSKNGGKTWQQGSNPAADKQGDQSHLDIIVDKQGVFHVVWLSDPEENGYQSLRYSRSLTGGQDWQAAMKLDDSTCSCCWNTLALAKNGSLNVLYRDMKPRDMALLQSTDAGVSWQRISTVGEFNWQFDGCPHIGGGLAIQDNHVYATVWTGLDTKAGLYTVSSNDNGRTWTQPKALGNFASHSDIAVNQNRIIAIWDERTADGSGIFIAKSQDNGATWSNADRLTEPKVLATHPRIVATQQGFLALWTEKYKKLNQWRVKVLN